MSTLETLCLILESSSIKAVNLLYKGYFIGLKSKICKIFYTYIEHLFNLLSNKLISTEMEGLFIDEI